MMTSRDEHSRFVKHQVYVVYMYHPGCQYDRHLKSGMWISNGYDSISTFGYYHDLTIRPVLLEHEKTEGEHTALGERRTYCIPGHVYIRGGLWYSITIGWYWTVERWPTCPLHLPPLHSPTSSRADITKKSYTVSIFFTLLCVAVPGSQPINSMAVGRRGDTCMTTTKNIDIER